MTGVTTMVDDGAGFVAATLAAAACDDFLVTALKNPNSCNFLSISSSLCWREFDDVDEEAALDIYVLRNLGKTVDRKIKIKSKIGKI